MYYIASTKWNPSKVFIVDSIRRKAGLTVSPTTEQAIQEFNSEDSSGDLGDMYHPIFRLLESEQMEDDNYKLVARSTTLDPESFRLFISFKPIQHKRRHYENNA